MKDILRTKSQAALDGEIERLVEALKSEQPGSEEYLKISTNIRDLCEARERKNPLQMDVNTLVAVGANILGLVIILNFERTGVITSKAFGWIFKGKS